jgi:hypothetical protein
MVTVIEIDRYAFANGIYIKDPYQFKIEVRKFEKRHPGCKLVLKKLSKHKVGRKSYKNNWGGLLGGGYVDKMSFGQRD